MKTSQTVQKLLKVKFTVNTELAGECKSESLTDTLNNLRGSAEGWAALATIHTEDWDETYFADVEYVSGPKDEFNELKNYLDKLKGYNMKFLEFECDDSGRAIRSQFNRIVYADSYEEANKQCFERRGNGFFDLEEYNEDKIKNEIKERETQIEILKSQLEG